VHSKQRKYFQSNRTITRIVDFSNNGVKKQKTIAPNLQKLYKIYLVIYDFALFEFRI